MLRAKTHKNKLAEWDANIGSKWVLAVVGLTNFSLGFVWLFSGFKEGSLAIFSGIFMLSIIWWGELLEGKNVKS